jgi:hypothetical protein
LWPKLEKKEEIDQNMMKRENTSGEWLSCTLPCFFLKEIPEIKNQIR